MRDLIVLERTELFERVWATPVATLAIEYGISGVGLAKICRSLDVPVPGRGYWARKAAGKRMSRPSLPALRKGQPDKHHLHRREPHARDSEATVELRQYESANQMVWIRQGGADGLVRRSVRGVTAAARRFTRAAERHRCLDLLVSLEQADRGLRIMDGLIRALEVRGNSVEILSDPKITWSSVTRVKIDGEWIHFALEERRIDARPPSGDQASPGSSGALLRPNGSLKLLITNAPPPGRSVRRIWADGKTVKLEARLNDFIVGLHQASEAIKTARAAREAWEAAFAEEQRLRQEQEKRAAIEERLQTDLAIRTEEWGLAQDQLRYLDHLESLLPSTDEDEAVGLWFVWTRDYALRAAREAASNLLDLRADAEPTNRWRSPTVTPEDVRQYLRTH